MKDVFSTINQFYDDLGENPMDETQFDDDLGENVMDETQFDEIDNSKQKSRKKSLPGKTIICIQAYKLTIDVMSRGAPPIKL